MLDKNQEYILTYKHLLASAKEIESDPSLEEFSADINNQLADFEENYPEIVSEYYFNKQED